MNYETDVTINDETGEHYATTWVHALVFEYIAAAQEGQEVFDQLLKDFCTTFAAAYQVKLDEVIDYLRSCYDLNPEGSEEAVLRLRQEVERLAALGDQARQILAEEGGEDDEGARQ